MKKLILFLFWLLLTSNVAGQSLFKKCDFSSSLTFSSDKDSKKSISFATGTRFSFNFFDFSFFDTLPKTQIQKLKKDFSEQNYFDSFNKVRFGGSVKLFQKTIPVNLQGGMLTFSRSISRLKTPIYSTLTSGVSKSFSHSFGLYSSIPSLSSSVKPLSFFLSADFFKIKFPLKIFTFFDDEKTLFLSTYSKFKFSPFSYLEFSANFGRFFLQSNSTLLKNNNLLFEGDFFNSASLEFYFNSPHFKNLFALTFHETPFEIPSVTINSKSQFKYSFFVLNLFYFSIPTVSITPEACPLISASSTLIKTVNQIELNPQILFLFRETSGRIGFSASKTTKICGTKKVSVLDILKINSSFLLESKNFYLKGNFTSGNILVGNLPSKTSEIPDKFNSFSVNFSRNFSFSRISFSSTIKNTPSIKEKNSSEKLLFSFDEGFSTGKKSRFYLNTGQTFSVEEKNLKKITVDFSLSLKKKFKYLNLNAKTTFIFNQYF